jgi:ubiquinone/menaquinone biosynthesis C-methylase UbiE
MAEFDYDRYVRAEWDLFSKNPARARASLAALDGRKVARVLDVGCGAGQEMIPFVVDVDVVGVGVDIKPASARIGRELFARHFPAASVAFVRGDAGALPIRSLSCDVVICRIALPYMDNRRALAEMSRVLGPQGLLLLKIHHARHYWRVFKRAATTFDTSDMKYALRAFAAGAVYHATGRQPPGKEVFETRWLITRELACHGLSIRGEMPDSNPTVPSYIISRR